MPEELKKQEVASEMDPSVAKQYDNDAPKSQQFKDLYAIIDANQITMFNTYRKNVGPVGRSMGIAKRQGPDILYLANKHSQKFDDIKNNKEVQIAISSDKTYDWVSITGKVTSTSNDDPRIKQLYSPMIKAWFGDLGDGVHDGTANDPRMALIEVKSTYITYYKKEVGTLGFMKEVGTAVLTGGVADTGVLRELSSQEIEQERS